MYLCLFLICFEGHEFIGILYCQAPPSKYKVYYYYIQVPVNRSCSHYNGSIFLSTQKAIWYRMDTYRICDSVKVIHLKRAKPDTPSQSCDVCKVVVVVVVAAVRVVGEGCINLRGLTWKGKLLKNLATLRSCFIVINQQITLKLGTFISFKALFAALSTNSRQLALSKVEKSVEGSVITWLFL